MLVAVNREPELIYPSTVRLCVPTGFTVGPRGVKQARQVSSTELNPRITLVYFVTCRQSAGIYSTVYLCLSLLSSQVLVCMAQSRLDSIASLESTIASLEQNLRQLKTDLETLKAQDQRPSLHDGAPVPNDAPLDDSQTSPPSLDLEEYRRYGRQMILPGFGLPGQAWP